MYAIAFQLQCKCNCIPIKSNDCNNNKKKDFPAIHILHILHTIKKRSRERHETKNKRSANLLAKQMKNTQTSHDIKKGYFIFVGGRKWKPIKRENKPQKPGLCYFLHCHLSAEIIRRPLSARNLPGNGTKQKRLIIK